MLATQATGRTLVHDWLYELRLFALEQFGSGLNSFQLLKHIPAHYLKIDRNYMAELPKHKENQEKIKEICDQAHHAGKLTVAEFVFLADRAGLSYAETAARLRDAGGRLT